jgi:hypothetical protein
VGIAGCIANVLQKCAKGGGGAGSLDGFIVVYDTPSDMNPAAMVDTIAIDPALWSTEGAVAIWSPEDGFKQYVTRRGGEWIVSDDMTDTTGYPFRYGIVRVNSAAAAAGNLYGADTWVWVACPTGAQSGEFEYGTWGATRDDVVPLGTVRLVAAGNYGADEVPTSPAVTAADAPAPAPPVEVTVKKAAAPKRSKAKPKPTA